MNTEVLEWILRTKGWRSLLEPDPDKWEDSAFVDPDGNWYNIDFVDHCIFAKAVIVEIKKLNEEEQHKIDYHTVSDDLVKIGWLLIHSDIAWGTHVYGYKHMNKKTIPFIEKTFQR